MKHAKPKKSQRIKHRQGLNDFLALGPDRSLEKLHQWYTKNVSKPPGRSIIGVWSTRYGWQTRAAEHDERVAGGVSQKVENAAVEENWNCVEELTELAQRSVKKALDALKDENMKATDPYGVAALLNTAVTCIKTIELLEGRATGRLGFEDIKDHAPEWLRERLTASTSPSTAAATGHETEVPENATRH